MAPLGADSVLLMLTALLIGGAVAAVQGYLLSGVPARKAHVAASLAAGTTVGPSEVGVAPPEDSLCAQPVVQTVEQATETHLDEMRALCQGVLIDADDPDPHNADSAMRRFLRAVGGRDFKYAAQRLVNTARWRYENKPWAWTCSFCEANPGHHTWRQVGVDKRRRPLVYSCLAQAATHRYTASCAVQHMVYSIEQAVRTMPQGEDGWLWLCDFSGFSLRAVDLSMASGVIRVVGEHYPERLALFICVNVPRLFVPAWRVLCKLIDPNTTRKAKFVASHEETHALLHEIMMEEDADWAMEELSTNLLRPIPAGQSAKGFWKPPTVGTHDPRGTPTYCKRYLVDRESARAGSWVQQHRPHPNIALHLAGAYDEPGAPSTTSCH